MQQKEMRFKRKLPNSSDAKMKRKWDVDGFPTFWLVLNILILGELVSLIEVLSKKNLKKLA
jgi:abortive infection bacteriophage resistance protein